MAACTCGVRRSRTAEIPADSSWINRRFVLVWPPLGAASLDGKTVAVLWVTGETAQPYRTDKGIAVGSTAEQVRGTYGTPSGSPRFNEYFYELIYDELGMLFWIIFGQVTHVDVFRPRTARTIWKF